MITRDLSVAMTTITERVRQDLAEDDARWLMPSAGPEMNSRSRIAMSRADHARVERPVGQPSNDDHVDELGTGRR